MFCSIVKCCLSWLNSHPLFSLGSDVSMTPADRAQWNKCENLIRFLLLFLLYQHLNTDTKVLTAKTWCSSTRLSTELSGLWTCLVHVVVSGRMVFPRSALFPVSQCVLLHEPPSSSKQSSTHSPAVNKHRSDHYFSARSSIYPQPRPTASFWTLLRSCFILPACALTLQNLVLSVKLNHKIPWIPPRANILPPSLDTRLPFFPHSLLEFEFLI